MLPGTKCPARLSSCFKHLHIAQAFKRDDRFAYKIPTTHNEITIACIKITQIQYHYFINSCCIPLAS